jgi:hypothetical protein
MNDMLIKAARYVSPEYVNKLTERIKELEAQLKAANDFATTLTGTHPDDIHKSRDERIGRLENRLRFGVSLPKITPELREEFSEACWLINAGGWSQDAVDFACVLNATLREQADNV